MFRRKYAIIGGMPEAVQKYAESQDIIALDDIYETLVQSYKDDSEKYVRGNKLTDVVRFILSYGWAFSGETITLGNFANSGYKSREVGEAFRLLEKAMLLELTYPVSSTQLPSIPETKRMPKLIWFDTGLVSKTKQWRQGRFHHRSQLQAISDRGKEWHECSSPFSASVHGQF